MATTAEGRDNNKLLKAIVEASKSQPREAIPNDARSDAARAPSGVEFPFVNAESRSEAHESRANESAGEAETDKEQQAPKPETEQIRGCIGRGHSYPRRKGLPACPLD